MTESVEEKNYELFRECFSAQILQDRSQGPSTKRHNGRKGTRSKKIRRTSEHETASPDDSNNDAEDLADFINYLAHEIFTSLPSSLRHVTYSAAAKLPSSYELPLRQSALLDLIDPISPDVSTTLLTYGILSPNIPLTNFLSTPLNTYLSTLLSTPPAPSTTRTDACELCERDWIPLTYHHLIPRSVHAKTLKRGWCREDEVQKVAWLCRACHNFVHSMASNEELAREWASVDKIAEREDVRRWIKWVGRVRWKKV